MSPERWFFIEAPGQINEATSWYVRTLEQAGQAVGLVLQRVARLRDVPRGARVLAIDCKTAAKVLLTRPGARCWLWVQGIVPEEAEFHFGSKLRKLYWTLLERYSLPRARGLFFVSQAMREHYASKYGMGELRPFVMPCVNQRLDAASFHLPGKYGRPTFVYAGSMHGWQCFDLTLEVFRRVQARLPEASLTVLTTEEPAAKAMVDGAKLENVSVGRVPLDRLQATLCGHKYGFVLRREHVINAVATPTKMSSYMAAGVIPITTTAVHDFAVRLRSLRHLILSDSIDPDEIAQRVLDFERSKPSADEVELEYTRLFRDYFDHDAYVPRIADYLRETGLEALGVSGAAGMAER